MFHGVACIGAGLIGSSWATLYASKGIQTFLLDLNEDILNQAMIRVTSNLEFLEAKGVLRFGGAKIAANRITPTLDLAKAVSGVEYVTESVTEDLETKKQVFREMDTLAPPDVILASSSSGLLMTDIQKATAHPKRCILAHPILPPHLIPLVEIAGGAETSPETRQKTEQFLKSVGKTPIVLNKEVPGYIVNRLQAAVWREAISLVAQGVASAEAVDTAFCLGIGLRDPLLGPFLRAHIAGNGIEHFLKNYAKSYENRWATMETWTSVPSSAAQTVINSVHHMPVVQTHTLNALAQVRDKILLQILKILDFAHPFYSD
jgi:3-hydroxypropionate dehydrogenase (NADP+)